MEAAITKLTWTREKRYEGTGGIISTHVYYKSDKDDILAFRSRDDDQYWEVNCGVYYPFRKRTFKFNSSQITEAQAWAEEMLVKLTQLAIERIEIDKQNEKIFNDRLVEIAAYVETVIRELFQPTRLVKVDEIEFNPLIGMPKQYTSYTMDIVINEGTSVRLKFYKQDEVDVDKLIDWCFLSINVKSFYP